MHRPIIEYLRILRLAVAAPLLLFFALCLTSAPLHAQSNCPQAQTITVPLPDPVSGRRYEIYVSLPDGYADAPSRTWPLVILADGGRAFPHLSCTGRTLARSGAIGADPVIVGLSYALGEDLENSRRRDYTPVARSSSDLAYGGATAYQSYLRNVVLRHIESNYRIDPAQRTFWGHSYGALLGSHILFTEPKMFRTYLLGSPSFWYENGAIYQFEEAYAAAYRRLDATVLLYVGGLEIARYDPARKGNTRDMVAGMHEFEARLRSRNHTGLRIASAVIKGEDHRSSVRPGFEWAITSAMPVR